MHLTAHNACLRQAPYQVHIVYDHNGIFRGEPGDFDATVTGFGKHPKTGEGVIILEFNGTRLGVTVTEWDQYIAQHTSV